MSALDPDTIGQLAGALPPSELAPILRSFETDLARLARAYEAAAAAADAEAARRTAHALAGTAAGIGARRLEAAARCGMDHAAADLAALAAAIRAEADVALAEIATLAGDPAGA